MVIICYDIKAEFNTQLITLNPLNSSNLELSLISYKCLDQYYKI